MRYVPEEKSPEPPEERRGSAFVRFVATDLNGRAFEIRPGADPPPAIARESHPVYALLNQFAVDAAKGTAPMFPLWLSPTQVRIIPVGREHLNFADALARDLAVHRVRADVDDRDDTVGKKIRNGEREWIPYLLVVGDNERESKTLPVRKRRENVQVPLRLAELIRDIHSQTDGLPYRPLPLPYRLSQRPIFFG